MLRRLYDVKKNIKYRDPVCTCDITWRHRSARAKGVCRMLKGIALHRMKFFLGEKKKQTMSKRYAELKVDEVFRRGRKIFYY